MWHIVEKVLRAVAPIVLPLVVEAIREALEREPAAGSGAPPPVNDR